MMQHIINASIQIVPLGTKDAYPMIDRAIEVIQASGLPYQVNPMETTVEGEYDTVMKVIKDAQQACLEAGAEEMVVNIKLHISKKEDLHFQDKTRKWR